MKKNYTFLSIAILASSLSFAQNRTVTNSGAYQDRAVEKVATPDFIAPPVKINTSNQKAPGDTLYYEDFNGSLPAGWTITNGAGNSNDWIWANSAPGGQYSAGTPIIASPTGLNGFISYPGDFYNTPTPPGGFTAADATVSSPAITILPAASVILEFHQSHRYCCNAAGSLVVEVSNNGTTWTTFDATLGKGPNTATTNPEVVRINVSPVLANQTTAYIRFAMTLSSHYYWMIDDVVLEEGNAFNMVLEDFGVIFTDDAVFDPIYSQIPQTLMMPIDFEFMTFNSGSSAQTGVTAENTIIQDSTYIGSSGVGVTNVITGLINGGNVASLQRDTTIIGTHINTTNGYHRSVFDITSNQGNQAPATAIGVYPFTVTDSVYGKFSGTITGSTGPGNFVGGGVDGDRWGSVYMVKQNGGVMSAIEIFVANRAENDGVSIAPRVWGINRDTLRSPTATLGAAVTVNPIGSSPFASTITNAQLGTWVRFPLFPPLTVPGDSLILIGWEQTGGAATGLEFYAGRDLVNEPLAPDVTNYLYVNDAAPAWGWTTRLAAMRSIWNFPPITTVGIEGVNLDKVKFNVSPNPNNGQFNVNISSFTEVNYTLNVRNMLGQIVHTELVAVNGDMNKRLDLTSFDKGVYFVSLENADETLVEKVILK